jgi:hypothetical protein
VPAPTTGLRPGASADPRVCISVGTAVGGAWRASRTLTGSVSLALTSVLSADYPSRWTPPNRRSTGDQPAADSGAPPPSASGIWAVAPSALARLRRALTAALAQGGYLDLKLLHKFNGGACPVWWVALAPFVRKIQIRDEDATEYQGFGWLAGEMTELDRRGGASVFD